MQCRRSHAIRFLLNATESTIAHSLKDYSYKNNMIQIRLAAAAAAAGCYAMCGHCLKRGWKVRRQAKGINERFPATGPKYLPEISRTRQQSAWCKKDVQEDT
jgi:hypothetical protein